MGRNPLGEVSNSNKKCKRYFSDGGRRVSLAGRESQAEVDVLSRVSPGFSAEQAGKAENTFTVGTRNFQALAVNQGQPTLEGPAEGWRDLTLPGDYSHTSRAFKEEADLAQVARLSMVPHG